MRSTLHTLNWRHRYKYHRWVQLLIPFLTRPDISPDFVTRLGVDPFRIVQSALFFDALLDRHFGRIIPWSHPFHLTPLAFAEMRGIQRTSSDVFVDRTKQQVTKFQIAKAPFWDLNLNIFQYKKTLIWMCSQTPLLPRRRFPGFSASRGSNVSRFSVRGPPDLW